MNFKKKVNGSWVDTPNYIHNTSTDTITTLPADIYANATTATVGLKGNEQHTGTPSPTSPIMPQGTGERTGNLADLYNVDKTQVGLRVTTGNNMKVVVNGTKGSGNNIIFIKVPNITVPAGIYTVKIKMTSGSITGLTSDGVFFGINASTYGQRTTPAVTQIGEVGTRTFTLSEDTTITSFDITPSYGSSGAVFDNATFECWFYAGSDNKPYEPYGYKIPISSNSTTTPVYLGEVQTTRKVKKLVLDGTENWVYQGTYTRFTLNLQNAIFLGIRLTPVLCTHYITIDDGRSITDIPNNTIYIGGSAGAAQIAIKTEDYSTKEGFAQYLAQQYAAETPVCVWYVLATEETAVVNEPLMRIGDYADTLSNVSIPVTAGANTLSVGTTVQPSEVTVNYKGWHPVADVHEKSRNLLPPPSQEQSGTLNGITYYVHADGSVDLSGIAEADLSIAINLANEFTIPVSASQGGGGTMALNNSFTNSSSITLLYNSTIIDSWGFTTTNRTATSYSAMANKTINRYRIGIVSGTNLSSGGKVGLAFSNNGTPVTPYQPYWT